MPGDGAPSPWIARFAPLVPAGAAVLDLACGRGRHTRLFLARSHPVTALDRDVGGLADIAGRPALGIVQADLEDGTPWPLAGRRFAAVVVVNYLWRPLFPYILDSVAANGVLLYDTFALGHAAYGHPRNPGFLLRPGELIDAVRGQLQIVAYEHGYLDAPRPMVKQCICAVRSEQAVPLRPDGRNLDPGEGLQRTELRGDAC
jgi:SAM-dependent methyltransferase